jgi:hypothetical protein
MKKIITKKKKRLLLLFVLFSTLVYGQVNPLSDYPSPNAASLGIYGQIPVSHFTGVPDISIPIHTIKFQELELPITLRYHVGSVKPDAPVGWVGLGWNLEAGGSITRIVRGRKDEITKREIEIETGEGLSAALDHPGYYYKAGELVYSPIWTDVEFLKKYSCLMTREDFYTDLAPDEFIFNFAGMSGSFFYNGKKEGKDQFKIKSKQNLSLDISVDMRRTESQPEYLTVFESQKDNYPEMHRQLRLYNYFLSFTITDHQGIKYIFGGDLNNIDFITTPVVRSSNIHTTTTPTTWHLKTILFPSGEKIEFTYKKEGDYFVITKMKEKIWVRAEGFTTYNHDNYQKDEFLAIQHSSYLEKITTPTGETIQFKSSRSYSELGYDSIKHTHQDLYTNPVLRDKFKDLEKKEYGNYKLKLDTIAISHGSNTIKNYYFTYLNANIRLTLDKLHTDYNHYQFKYNLQYLLPRYNSRQIDHWGFYNGQQNDGGPTGMMAESRQANPTLMKAQTLEKIIYPTGGYTLFEYEAHNHSKRAVLYGDQYFPYGDGLNTLFTLADRSGTAGGLRIKKITSRPKDSTSEGEVVKEYFYTLADGKTSSGILSGTPIYGTAMEQRFEEVETKKNFAYWAWTILTFGSSPFVYNGPFTQELMITSEHMINPLGNTAGAHVTYSRIEERNSDKSSSVFYYTNHEEAQEEPAMKAVLNGKYLTPYPEPFTSRELGRGLLKAEVHRNSNNVVLDSIAYTYSLDYSNYVKSININRRKFDNFARIDVLTCTKLYTFIPKLTEKKAISYDQNGANPVTTTTNYTYNPHNLLSSTTFDRSDGKKQTTQLVYPFEITQGTDATIMASMTNKHILSNYIDKITYLDNGQIFEREYRKFSALPNKENLFRLVEIHYLGKNRPILFDNSMDSVEPIVSTYTASFGQGQSPTYKDATLFVDANTITKVKIEFFYEKPVNTNDILILTITQTKNGVTTNRDLDEASSWRLEESGGSNGYMVNSNNSHPDSLSFYKEITLSPDPDYYTIQIRSLNHSQSRPGPYLSGRCTATATITPQVDRYLARIKELRTATESHLKPEFLYGYDEKGNIRSVVSANNTTAPTIYIWGYKHQYPIAEIKNATFTEVETEVKRIFSVNNVDELSDKATPDETKLTNGSLQKALPNALVTTYTYKPLVGIQTVTDPRGIKTTYSYGPFNRLLNIKDHNGKTLESYEYRYRQ